MAEESPRMGLPYPSEFDENWYATFEDFVSAMDGHHFASFEDRNIFFLEGGTFTWDSVTPLLTWSADLKIIAPSTGRLSTLAAGSIALADGDFLVVDLTRGPTTTVTLSAQALASIDPDDAPVVICVRNGSKLYFRNGAVLDDSDAAQVFDAGPSAPSSRIDRADDFTGDGSTTDFVLSFTPNADSLVFVFQAGLLMTLTDDYTFAGSTVSFVTAPVATRKISVRYFS